jgi:hypothetical protein
MEADPVLETLFPSYLEFRMVDKVLKPSDSQCYTPSSEPLDCNLNEAVFIPFSRTFAYPFVHMNTLHVLSEIKIG